MKTLIDNYRGWDIYYDTEIERFVVASDGWDQRSDRGSFSSCKRWVDDHIKANSTFTPFEVQHWPGRTSSEILTITGIRKDGRPATKNANGVVGQMTDYSIRDYILRDPDNDPIFSELVDFDRETSRLEAQREILRRAIADKVVAKPLADYLKTLPTIY